MQETLNSKKHGDIAFRAKDFGTAIDCYTQVIFLFLEIQGKHVGCRILQPVEYHCSIPHHRLRFDRASTQKDIEVYIRLGTQYFHKLNQSSSK